jgi:23S rRNA (uridine2552-2'-O)-methyltransferase
VPRRPSRHQAYDRKDAHYRRARAAGYRARSAYKLIELDDRHRLLRPGDLVVDLGAWPGAWMQVAAERVGPAGRVVGIDLAPIEPLGSPRVASVTGDVRDPAAISEVRRLLDGQASVVLCDLAPKLTGIRDTDEARASELANGAIALLGELLRPGGRLVLKLFMNQELSSLVRLLETRFEQVKTTRPEATRRGSSELYVVASGFQTSCG